MLRIACLVLLILFASPSVPGAPKPTSADSPPDPIPVSYSPAGQSAFADFYIRAPRLGVAHITHPSIEDPTQRYENALLIGAGWNRFPVYWSDIESSSGQRNWESFDRIVMNDVRYGLKTDLILLNVPPYRRDGGSIANLYAPVFADGTDNPAPGKALNPANYWGDFVAEAVRRYMPGGVLAQFLGWSADQGVRVWEAWNEPDLSMFWQGTPADYARLLKVTYLVVHQVDPDGRVMTAGFAYQDPNYNDWLDRVLSIYASDPGAPASNWYMDIVALHTYVDPYRSPRMVNFAQATLARYGLTRPIWLNETGVPVWDDYPGPTWTAGLPGLRQYRRTMKEQAQYVIQSTTMAWAAGADVIFIHELYDDCAASPVGTDFPPHNGSLCRGDDINLCSGEAFGLFRNPADADCFTQHPQPGTPRPAATAYYELASIFGDRSLAYVGQIELNAWGRALVFDFAPPLTGVAYDPARIGLNDELALPGRVQERAWVMWNWSTIPYDLEIPASGSSARLYTMTDDYRLAPENGIYTITLPKVNPGNYPALSDAEIEHIDGEPYILVETVPQNWFPTEPQLTMRGVGLLTTSSPTVEPPTQAQPPTDVPAGIPTPIPTLPPTLDPALDTTPPIPRMAALPPTSPSSFVVQWSAEDESGIAQYIVWVRVDGGEWTPWLESSETSASFQGESGRTYEFSLWAVDLAGNWSTNLDLLPLAATRVE